MTGLLSAQRLVWMQLTPSGSVVPMIHPKPVIDPVRPAFSNDYEYFRNWECEDSLFTHLNFHSPRYGNSTEDRSEKRCLSEIDFAYPFLVYFGEWVNNPDLYPIINIRSGFSTWNEIDAYTRELKSYDHRYICGNDRTGHDVHEHQIWQMDSSYRVKTINDVDEQNKPFRRFDFTYTPAGKLQTAEQNTYHGYYDGNSPDSYQQWFYDKQQRQTMMLKYTGTKHDFDAKTLSFFKQELSRHIRTGKSRLPHLIDSLNIEIMLVYNYGKYGLEQANCYYSPNEYDLDNHYYSDSIFYNGAGKIVRYKGGKNTDGDWSLIRYSYDKTSGRLATVSGREYSASADRGASEAKIQQTFSYSNGRVSSLKERIFEIDYEYKNEKYMNPKEVLEEERVYTYTYKTGKH